MTPTTPQGAGSKRAYQSDEQVPSQPDRVLPDSPQQHATSSAATSAFRNVSACNRCRVRKNKCDQRLPACTACEKAGTRCVGFDPITKKEIPRSYVYFLESRLLYLEQRLVENNVQFKAADAFEDGAQAARERADSSNATMAVRADPGSLATGSPHSQQDDAAQAHEDEKISKIVSDIGMVSVHGASDRRYLGSTSGISFARVVLSAIKSSTSTSGTNRRRSRSGASPTKSATAATGSTMRDSYFGLSTRPSIREAPFPDKDLAAKLVHLYFEHANPQIPILHRVEFMKLFERVYGVESGESTPRELYLLNIVFAIGAGVIFGSSDSEANQSDHTELPAKRARLTGRQAQPEEYHASAIVHLGSFLSSSVPGESAEKSGGDLEDLQAILLLAGYALLRPVAPGLWYIIGVAMRLAVDLGLHFEDGQSLDEVRAPGGRDEDVTVRRRLNGQQRGRSEFTRDMRRRLWWCTYCFDRLVSTCVGRPFGITDSVVTTEFPSLLEDKYITRNGLKQSQTVYEPSYKHVAHHYLRFRLLQSEILQVLQYQQAQQARAMGANMGNSYVHKTVPSPFLMTHPDFRSWRSNIDQRLWEWKESAPQRNETGVSFSVQFLELNYWQAVIMLYRNSLSVPEPFAGETSPTEEVSTPTSPPAEQSEDQDLVFLKCAEAGQKTLKLYRQLHRKRLVNYTYLATHHLFMAGISFLYAVWHSPAVRSRLTIDDFDFTVLAATSVLGDLMEKCPPAQACRDAFERMSKATVQMCMNTPGFKLGHSSDSAPTSNPALSPRADPMVVDMKFQQAFQPSPQKAANRRPPPQFDMDLHELFPEDLDVGARPSRSLLRTPAVAPRVQQNQQRFGDQSRLMSDRSQRPNTSISSRNRSTSMTSGPLAPSAQISPPSVNTGMNSPSYFNINQNSYNPDFMSNVPGMEFLNSLGQNSAATGTQAALSPMLQHASGGENSPGLGFHYDAMGDSPMGYERLEYGSGFDFGVGMGLDFGQQHGWNDPQGGFDLDGFFFGGNGS